MDYLRHGLIVPPVKQVTESYREDMDPVGSFVDGCVFRAGNSSRKFVTARQMLDAYTAYCHANSLRVYTQKNFANILAGKGIKKLRKSGQIRYLDMELHDVPEDPSKFNAMEPR